MTWHDCLFFFEFCFLPVPGEPWASKVIAKVEGVKEISVQSKSVGLLHRNERWTHFEVQVPNKGLVKVDTKLMLSCCGLTV